MKAEGKILGFRDTSRPCLVDDKKKQKPYKAPKPEPKGLQFIKRELDKNNIGFMTEYRFAKPKRFKFDICIPALMIAIEYEGLGFKKTGHTTSDGYTKNCEKYNLAATKGWKMYR